MRGNDSDPTVTALLAGDEQAFTDLVRSLEPMMLRLALRHVATASSAEEVVQDTWVVVVRSLPTYQARASLRTWVIAILLNLAKSRGRADRQTVPFCDLPASAIEAATTQVTAETHRSLGHEESPAPDGDFVPAWRRGRGTWRRPPEAWPPQPEQSVLDGELRTVLDTAIGALPVRQRAVLQLRDGYGLSTQETGDLLDLEPGTVRVVLHRARTTLRMSLAAHQGASAAHPMDGRP